MLVLVTTAASLNIKLEKENISKNIILNNQPDRPTVTGPTSGKAGTSYTYTATTKTQMETKYSTASTGEMEMKCAQT